MSYRAITAKLTTRAPLHIGTGSGTETADDLVRRDAQGRVLIPGTALGGALRTLATRLAPRLGGRPCKLTPRRGNACGCPVCELFGEIAPQETTASGKASRLIIHDAILAAAPPVQIRDGVGIDRVTGAAARRERIKFDLEVVPASAVFDVRIELEPDTPHLDLLAASLAEWQTGRGALGGRVGRGMGAFDVTDVTLVQRDLNDAQTLMAYLKSDEPWQGGGDTGWLDTTLQAARAKRVAYRANETFDPARRWVVAEFTLQADGPLLTHDLVQAARSGFDHAPLLAAYVVGATPVLPGSSLRGVLRSQAERIARTLVTLRTTDSAGFLAHCAACSPLVGDADLPLASCDSLLRNAGHGTDEELDPADLCLACTLFGSPRLGSRLRVEDALLKAGTSPVYKALDFLAVDRFTGGGRDSAKFDAAVLWQPAFTCRLYLENPADWELGWLALVLRDLREGWLSVGMGRSKGFGAVHITDGRLQFGFVHPGDWPEVEALAPSPRDSGIYRVADWAALASGAWLALADRWVRAFVAQVHGFERPKDLLAAVKQPQDTYFGTTAEHLYHTAEGLS